METPLAVTFCVKGGSAGNSGVETASVYTVDFVNSGGQNPAISNFVVYGIGLTPVTALAASVTPPSCTAAASASRSGSGCGQPTLVSRVSGSSTA